MARQFITVKVSENRVVVDDVITFVVALRGREHNIAGFVENIVKYYDKYRIIFAVQADDKPFNKGGLYNLAIKYCNTEIIVFCDVDVRMREKIDFRRIIERVNKPFVPYLTTYNIVNDLPIGSNNHFGKRVVCVNKKQFVEFNGYNEVIKNVVRVDGAINHVHHKPATIELADGLLLNATVGKLVFSEKCDKMSVYCFENIGTGEVANNVVVEQINSEKKKNSIKYDPIKILFSDIYDGVKKKVTFNIATYPKREKALGECLKILLNDSRIDLVRVYLNEYDSVPKCCLHEKVEYVIGGENLKDTGKYYWAGDYKDEFYFTLDDDLGIDDSYIDKHLALLREHLNSIFVTLHGKTLKPEPTTFRDYINPVSCLKPCLKDTFINFPGTGVCLFDNSRFVIDYKTFKHHGMADLWVAKYLQEKKIPCVVRKHGFEMKLLYNDSDTLYNQRKSLHKNHVEILNSVDRWVLHTEYDYVVTKKEYDYCININSYNRSEMLETLIGQINENDKYRMLINVFDDCSDNKERFAEIVNRFDNVVLYRFSENHGKGKYWKIYDTIFKICKDINSKYFIFLPDDVKLKNNFFKRTTDLFESINDDDKICMSLLIDELRKWKPCWTNFTPVQVGSVYKTQWNDLCFISEKLLMEKLDFRVDEIPQIRFKKRNISSGVGQQISQKLHNIGLSMYHSKYSLVIHGDHESQMNKEERKKHKLIAK